MPRLPPFRISSTPKENALSEGLKVALLTDRKTAHLAPRGGNRNHAGEVAAQPPGAAPVQVHQVALGAGESLNLVVVIPQQDKVEAEVSELRGKVAETFDRCKKRVEEISHRVRLKTPDTLVDLGARSLCVSMDALWFPPVFMHGPIRWGFPGLTGLAHGLRRRRVRQLRSRGLALQVLRRPPHEPAAWTASRTPIRRQGLTRQAGDSLLFSQGGVVSCGLYNMTEMWLSFIAHHYAWTGDAEYLRAMWPAIRDAVAFEKRVFDMDGDSLYENYANAYITDAHWHNGGNCAQASAYMYRGNLLAAEAARLVGQSPEPFLAEAARIRAAMNRVLWMKKKGVYAEWKDVLGEKLLHPEPELGSIYLSIDCGVADPFQAYQMLRFTEWGLPNYCLRGAGPQPFDGYYRPGSTYEFPQPMQAREVKSSNWRPLVVSCHECSPGEQMDTARAYYKLGLERSRFPLVKAILRCMVNLTAVGGLVIRDINAEQPRRSWGEWRRRSLRYDRPLTAMYCRRSFRHSSAHVARDWWKFSLASRPAGTMRRSSCATLPIRSAAKGTPTRFP